MPGLRADAPRTRVLRGVPVVSREPAGGVGRGSPLAGGMISSMAEEKRETIAGVDVERASRAAWLLVADVRVMLGIAAGDQS